MVDLPPHVLQEVVDVLLKHSDLSTPPNFLLSKPASSASLASLDVEANVLESVAAHFQMTVSHHLASIRRRRNFLTPLYRLPPEILATIFENTQDLEANHKARYDAIKKLARVSAHWLSTVLSSPQLWTVIDSASSTSLIKTALSRSKGVLVDIYLSGRGDRVLGDGILELLKPHIRRWKELHISSPRFAKFLHVMGDVELLPQLECFMVDAAYNGEVVPDFIQRRAPRLRTLSIAPFTPPLGAPVLGALRRLDFTPVTRDGFELSSDQWQTLLGDASQLEYIRVIGKQEMKQRDGPFHPFYAHLPRLKRISLESLDISTITMVISSITISPQSYPCVQVRSARIASQAPSTSINGMFLASRQPQSLSWLIHSMKWMSARVEASALIIEAGEKTGERFLEFHASPPQLLPTVAFAVLVPPDGLPMLESLSLSDVPLYHGRSLVRPLSRLRNLRKLDIIQDPRAPEYPNNLKALILALSTPTPSEREVSTGWLFPELQDFGIATSGTFDAVLPLIKARYGQVGLSLTEALPARLEVLRLRILSTTSSKQVIDPVLVDRLHEILDVWGTKLEIISPSVMDQLRIRPRDSIFDKIRNSGAKVLSGGSGQGNNFD